MGVYGLMGRGSSFGELIRVDSELTEPKIAFWGLRGAEGGCSYVWVYFGVGYGVSGETVFQDGRVRGIFEVFGGGVFAELLI